MQGVQVAPGLNDENSSAQQQGPLHFKQQPASSMPLQAAKQQGSALKSARKAFGNITNSAQPRGGDASAAKPSAMKPAQHQRRAFGDITNSAAKPPASTAKAALLSKAQGAGSSMFAPQQQQQQQPLSSSGVSSSKTHAPAAAAAAAATVSSSSSRWPDGLEPERPAGKTWEQLEAERWAQLDADADASANKILAGLHACTAPVLVPRIPVQDSDNDDDVMPAGGLRAPWAAPSAAAAPDAPLDELLLHFSTGDLASVLPDIPLPEEGSSSGGEEEEQEQETAGEAAAAGTDEPACRSPPAPAAVVGLHSPGDALPW